MELLKRGRNKNGTIETVRAPTKKQKQIDPRRWETETKWNPVGGAWTCPGETGARSSGATAFLFATVRPFTP